MLQRQLTFQEAVQRAITLNYCNFNGRASRSEYWWFVLFTFVLGVLISVVFSFSDTLQTVASSLVNLALLLPGLGLAVRRLHDLGKSGWNLLLALIPIVGAIILIVWFIKESDPQANKYGEVPNVA